MYHHRIIRFFINVQVQEQHPHPLPGSWLAVRMADLIQDLQYVYHESFHSLHFLSVICFHVILGLPGSCFPSTCMSKALLTAPLEHSTCPYQQSFFASRMRYRSSMQTCTSNSLDLVVTMSCSLTLQMSDHCPVNSLQTLEVWLCQWPSLTGMEHCALHTTPVHIVTCLEKELAGRAVATP